MPDLITLASPAFPVLLFAEAIAGAIMGRETCEFKDAGTAAVWPKLLCISGNPGWPVMRLPAQIPPTNRSLWSFDESR